VVTAYAMAQELHLPLEVTCPKKIGAPGNAEYAIGAVTETGEALLNERAMDQLGVSATYIEEKIREKTTLAQERLKIYRKNREPHSFKDKILIVVDDGIATGFTIKAAIKSLKKSGPKKIIVATPVSSKDALEEIKQLVDEVICLLIPPYFQAVGQFYEMFDQTSDEEVIFLLNKNI
jgi:putative phosphoribosyl transferase